MNVLIKGMEIPKSCTLCFMRDDFNDYCPYEQTKEKDCPLIEVPILPEPLTDKEQRIFLAAMEREKKVCEEVDSNYIREPYEDSLMSVCREIERKVKNALWLPSAQPYTDEEIQKM